MMAVSIASYNASICTVLSCEQYICYWPVHYDVSISIKCMKCHLGHLKFRHSVRAVTLECI